MGAVNTARDFKEGATEVVTIRVISSSELRPAFVERALVQVAFMSECDAHGLSDKSTLHWKPPPRLNADIPAE
jgi:hypothetical protein